MAQIYVNNVLAKPKSIHVYDELTKQWKTNRIGYVYYNGGWLPFIQYILVLYKNGVENIPFFQGYSTSGSFTKNESEFEIYIYGANKELNIDSDIRIDVSNFSFLKMKWYAPDNSSLYHYVKLGLATDKGLNTFVAEEVLSISSGNNGKELSVDISSLSGNFYVVVGMKSSTNSTGRYYLRITDIWME